MEWYIPPIMEESPEAPLTAWRHRELSDLSLLLGGLVLVPAIWVLVMGWHPGVLLMAHDGKESHLSILRDLLEQGGCWTSNLYATSMLGGVPVHDVVGTPQLYRLCGALGLSAVSTVNLLAMFVQLLMGFFAARTMCDLTRAWTDGREPGRLEALSVLVMGAFAPALAWRLGYGHIVLVFGVLAFAPGAALMAAAVNGTFTVTLIVTSILAMTHAFSTSGHQLVICGALFGLPFFAAMALRVRSVGRVIVPLLCVASALGLAVTRWTAMVAFAISSDASRALGGPSAIYSYATSSARDMASCVTWGNQLLPTGRDMQLWHELNYPVGPLLLLLFLLPWRRFRWPLSGLLLGVVFAVAFCMDLPGAARFLTTLCPPLSAFRCPQRALLPFALLLPAVAVAALIARAPVAKYDESHISVAAGTLAGCLLGTGILALSPGAREIVLWVVTAIALFRAGASGAATRIGVVILITAGSLGAFRERLLPFLKVEQVVDIPLRTGKMMREAAPSLESALERIQMDFQLTVFQVNTVPAMRLSTLDGYWIPPRRFLALAAGLLGQPPDPMVNLLTFHPQSPNFRILRQLYNVRWNVFQSGGLTRFASPGPTAGPAWFSHGFQAVADTRALCGQLLAWGDSTSMRAAEVVLIPGDDPFAAPALSAMLGLAMSPAAATDTTAPSIREVKAPQGRPVVTLDVTTPRLLPLTVALNFTERLRAYSVRADATREPLVTFPAYGALLGVLVPAGTTRIQIEPEPFLPGWVRVMEVMGWILLLLAAWAGRRVSRRAGLADPA